MLFTFAEGVSRYYRPIKKLLSWYKDSDFFLYYSNITVLIFHIPSKIEANLYS